MAAAGKCAVIKDDVNSSDNTNCDGTRCSVVNSGGSSDGDNGALPMDISLKMNNYKVDILPIFIHKKGGKNNLKIMATMQREKLGNKFYEVLSLHSTNVGFEEIKKAYRCKALQYHPDICDDSNKEEPIRRFIELRKAYETLSDPISRQIYDYELSLMDSFESELMWRKS
ncbi:chaperone protein dnaJ A6, chloroplastic-like [Capsicum annuum]|uniref:chaperone protein dnaJ A6, chloroplastic-like n=1 Tax=Capsicum annuum TaxID=4072 RepID=UPI001FB12F5A|nr:chaperone protein dnaJ A6, chloroplastic-like [Capsicum annuum]